jgi:hypothetical protein
MIQVRTSSPPAIADGDVTTSFAGISPITSVKPNVSSATSDPSHSVEGGSKNGPAKSPNGPTPMICGCPSAATRRISFASIGRSSRQA